MGRSITEPYERALPAFYLGAIRDEINTKQLLLKRAAKISGQLLSQASIHAAER